MRLASFCSPYLAVSLLALALTGCSLSTTAAPSPDNVSGLAISGQVHGGQQAIKNARVFLFAASTAGYGQLSTSLLQSGNGTVLDTTADATNGDYYVTTANDGSFSITGDYSCTANTQVYLYAVGGDPGNGVNTAAGLMAVLGNCPITTNFLVPYPLVQINEVTTIAAAYAFAGYATDAVHVSSPNTTMAKTGIANAFANAANLASIVTGYALATTPGSTGSGFASNIGTVPQGEIYALADILSSCINSTGLAAGSDCVNLFAAAPNGSTPPTDTATAAINIAHSPGAHASALWALLPSMPPYITTLTAAPNDWTIAVNFTANIGGGQVMFNNLAVDSAGNIWIASEDAVIKISPVGVELNGPYGYFGGGLSYPLSIAIDTTGNVWIANYNGANVSEYNYLTGASLAGATGYAAGGNPYSIAIDASNDVWVANSAYLTHSNTVPYSISELSNSTGANINGSPFTDTSIDIPESIAIDASGNAWVADLGAYATQISSTGTVTGYANPGPNLYIEPTSVAVDNSGNKWFNNDYGSTNYGWYFTKLAGSGGTFTDTTYSTGGMQMSASVVAIDGSGHIFLTTSGNGVNPNYSTWVGEFSSAGAVLTPSNGYHDATSTCEDASGMAVDASGNLWVSCGGPSIVMEYVGVATPVVTPIVANLLPPYNAPASKP